MDIRTRPATDLVRRLGEHTEILALGALGVVLTALASQFPRTGDDWAWGSYIGIDRLDAHFADYNGRYVGNLAVLALTRVNWLVPIVVAATVCVLLRLLAELVGRRDLASYAVAASLLIAMPLAQWRQTVVWVSGFTNYTLAAVVLLAFCISVKRDLAPGPGTRQRLGLLAGSSLFVLATAGQLLVEHVTVFIALASSVYLVVRVVRRQGLTQRAVIWMAGAMVGAAVMFSNSAYRGAAQGVDRYQGFGASGSATGATGVAAIVRQGARGVSQYAVAGNTVLNAALFLLVLGLGWAAWSRTRALSRGQVAALATATVSLFGGTLVAQGVEPGRYFGSLSSWAWFPAGCLLAALLLTARTLVRSRERAWTIATLSVAVLVLDAPMAAVTPYGPRNFLPSYLLMVAIALLLMSELQQQVPAPVLPAAASLVALGVLVVVLAQYFATYTTIDRVSDHRLDTVRRAVREGRHSVTVSTLPFPDHVHAGDPVPGQWADRYRAFYHLPQDLEIRLRDRYARRDLGPTPQSD